MQFGKEMWKVHKFPSKAKINEASFVFLAKILLQDKIGSTCTASLMENLLLKLVLVVR